MQVSADSSDPTIPAVKGDFTGAGATYVNDGGTGVLGHSTNGYGVHGISEIGRGVVASSNTNYAMRAHSLSSSGARISSGTGVGVEGQTGLNIGAGMKSGPAGIVGSSPDTVGVLGTSPSGTGISGTGKTGGNFEGTFEGIHVVGHDTAAAGVAGYNTSTGPGIYGKSVGGAAAYFDGDVVVTGDIQLHGADYAEDFDTIDCASATPGTVMVLDDSGAVRVSEKAYDHCVAGVVSGAGDYKPAVILDRHDTPGARRPLALMGKVYCRVDATDAPIAVGDLLTTSATPGHAMKVVDPNRAFGAVIGKALRPLAQGRGVVPILVALQ